MIEKNPSALINILLINRLSYYGFKRVLDFCISLICLILLLPLMGLISILIVLDSPGPALFIQTRVGVKLKVRNGVIQWERMLFPCYKFRTMSTHADPTRHQNYIRALISNDTQSMEEIQGKQTDECKLVDDPRVTRLGRILRKMSIDEFPQFVNVLKGEMSLVGPRPAIPYEVPMYKPWYFKRLETKPGLTGLWQVTARSSVNFDEMVNLDIQYVDQQSFWLDLIILFKTPFVVLSTKGAH